jgi:threonine dehydrogenase-like Zn-dependent dehydrogenase
VPRCSPRFAALNCGKSPTPRFHFPTDAVVTVTASCVCGSDLHGYRGHAATVFPRRIGHEFIGVVSETGSEVTTVAVGDLVIAPFAIS